MRHLRAIRVLTAMALVVPASLATWAVTGPASATTFVSCSKLTGLDTAKFTTLSGCTDPADTGGTGKGVSKAGKGTTGTSTITWATKADGTTSVSYSYTIVAASKEKCGTSVVKGKKTDNLEVIESGKVLAVTGNAAKVIKVGQAASSTTCINASTNAESLLKPFVF
jgi:hypothetical protein